VRKRVLPAAFVTIFSVLIIGWGCTKIDATTLGTDLIPEVDNIHTFRDTFTIETSQHFFNDTSVVSLSNAHVLGTINNDPLFGNTTANLFMQLKPAFFPYYFGSSGDTVKNYTGVGVDSVVLCMSYDGLWGDTNIVQQLQVFEINDQVFSDSANKQHNLSYEPVLGNAVSGIVSIKPAELNDKVKFNQGRDSITNQIRIKLSAEFATRLFGEDSAKMAVENGFYSDSVFRKTYHGFALKSISGNGIMYVNITDPRTRLDIFFRKFKNGKYDTTYNSFPLHAFESLTSDMSATANSVIRNRAGSPADSPDPGELYLQGGPGSYVNLHFPGFHIDSTVNRTNKIVNRAEIVIEQIPDNLFYDSIFSPPVVYVDIIDTANTKWKPLYYDLNPMQGYDPDLGSTGFYFPTQIDQNYFGGYSKSRINGMGQQARYYTINVTRYMQNLITKERRNYDMRLFAPFKLKYPQYTSAFIEYANPVAFGRIKIGSGNNISPVYRMKLVMTWTKM